MKSTLYGNFKDPAEGLRPGQDMTETIVVERPLTAGIYERLLDILRLPVGPNARWLYLYYNVIVGHDGEVKKSLHAQARDTGMDRQTLRRARAELGEAHLILSVGTNWNRLLVIDYKNPLGRGVQNEPGFKMNRGVQNEPASPITRTGVIVSLEESFNQLGSLFNDEGSDDSLNRENLSSRVVGHSESDWMKLFDSDPQQPPSPPSAASRGGTFRLTPPGTPLKGRRRSPRALKSAGAIPGYAFPAMYKICFGVSTAQQRRSLTQEQTGRVSVALDAIQYSGGDLSRIYEFGTWYWNWATRHPSPETVQKMWWRAMSEIDNTLGQEGTRVSPDNPRVGDVSDEEYERIVQSLKRRAKTNG